MTFLSKFVICLAVLLAVTIVLVASGIRQKSKKKIILPIVIFLLIATGVYAALVLFIFSM